MKWLFLVHQVQTPNSRERVKVWRMTKKVGAILYRNSVYVLPYDNERLEDFQWLSQQIRDSKGEASVFVSESESAKEDRLLRSLFEQGTKEEYGALATSLRAFKARVVQVKTLRQSPAAIKGFEKDCKKLQEEFTMIQRTDFFGESLAAECASELAAVRTIIGSMEPLLVPVPEIRVRRTKEVQGKTWSTRKNIHIDRVCSAWLIRRFIDRKAAFVFAAETRIPKGTIPFDVVGAEFGHHGDRCTFETLLTAFQIDDPALRSIAQIVHDVDLKDHKFGRPEAEGIDVIIRALSDSLRDDQRVLEIGSVMLDALYRRLARGVKKR